MSCTPLTPGTSVRMVGLRHGNAHLNGTKAVVQRPRIEGLVTVAVFEGLFRNRAILHHCEAENVVVLIAWEPSTPPMGPLFWPVMVGWPLFIAACTAWSESQHSYNAAANGFLIAIFGVACFQVSYFALPHSVVSHLDLALCRLPSCRSGRSGWKEI